MSFIMLVGAGEVRAASITSIDCSDTSLTALKAAIESHWHALGGGGFKQDSTFSVSPHADPCASMTFASNMSDNSPTACKYANAYDLLHTYLLYDFLDPDGGYSCHTNLYAAWEVSGFIGDANGDGNPDAGGVTPCHPQLVTDQKGIDQFDDYHIEFYQCSPDPGNLFAIIQITNNSIQVTDGFGTPLLSFPPGVTISFSPGPPGVNPYPRSHALEMCVTNLETLLDAVLDLSGSPHLESINGLVASFRASNGRLRDVHGEQSCPRPMQR